MAENIKPIPRLRRRPSLRSTPPATDGDNKVPMQIITPCPGIVEGEGEEMRLTAVAARE